MISAVGSQWPPISDFIPMLQNPSIGFCDVELKTCEVERDIHRQPRPRAGSFAVCYKATSPSTGKNVCIRLFARESEVRRERYSKISEYLNANPLGCLVRFEYLEKGIRHPNPGKYGNRVWFPMVRMDWIEGSILFDWLRERCTAKDSRSISNVAERWIELAQQLEDIGVAHGDLQHASVMVSLSGELKLVDYDGMCVPALVGRANLELGTEPYQHPERNEETKLFPGLDRFSELFILIVLRALAADPTLWFRHIEPPVGELYDKLLFRKSDFDDPARSVLFGELMRSTDPDIARLTQELFHLVNVPLDAVLPLASFLQTPVASLLQTSVVDGNQSADASLIDEKPIKTSRWTPMADVVLGILQRPFTARRKKAFATCPRCLAVGTLIREPAPTNIPPDFRKVCCTNVIDEQSYEECGFTFYSRYRDWTKISFSTLGVAAAGKLHWLAMVYREIMQGKTPDEIDIERVESCGSMRCDRIVNSIVQDRVGPSATINDLPEPVLFALRRRSALGLRKTRALVSLLNFAGTTTMSSGLNDFIRRRQLSSDGFLFFLDPTRPSDSQLDPLLRFREQLRLVKRVDVGHLRTPIAVCVSQIDRTVYQDYARGGDVMTSFFEELGRIDTRTRPMSLARMRKRSDLMSVLWDTIWPGWEIEKQLRPLVGERFMFFPMTPVGLPPEGGTDERIINDLTQRTIEPYGILEPLLWLLHMNGYPVLKP